MKEIEVVLYRELDIGCEFVQKKRKKWDVLKFCMVESWQQDEVKWENKIPDDQSAGQINLIIDRKSWRGLKNVDKLSAHEDSYRYEPKLRNVNKKWISQHKLLINNE